MPYRVPTALDLSEAERAELEGWARRRKTAQALALRARIVLRAAAGLSNTAVAAELEVSKHTVGKWRERFARPRADGLLDEPRPGAPRRIGDERVAELSTRRSRPGPRARPAGADAPWRRPRACRPRRWAGSGAPSSCGCTEPRPSRSPPTRCSPRRYATSSASTWRRPIALWSCASTRRAGCRR